MPSRISPPNQQTERGSPWDARDPKRPADRRDPFAISFRPADMEWSEYPLPPGGGSQGLHFSTPNTDYDSADEVSRPAPCLLTMSTAIIDQTYVQSEARLFDRERPRAEAIECQGRRITIWAPSRAPATSHNGCPRQGLLDARALPSRKPSFLRGRRTAVVVPRARLGRDRGATTGRGDRQSRRALPEPKSRGPSSPPLRFRRRQPSHNREFLEAEGLGTAEIKSASFFSHVAA